MLADSYYVMADDGAARDAALSGLAALGANDGEPLQHRLTLSSIYLSGSWVNSLKRQQTTRQLRRSCRVMRLTSRVFLKYAATCATAPNALWKPQRI